ncbi:MAG: hypothetical protein IIC03_04780, partial [Proteobacteria bacterium]|nr:hypothetical protein [Pseudomonadota bacterium]
MSDGRVTGPEAHEQAGDAMTLVDKVQTIKWIDSHNYGGWWDNDTDFVPVEVLTVGHLVKETDTYVVIAQGKGSNGSWTNIAVIPKVCIHE